jgi:SPX domain protein involved in polyphosphate accumulation
MGFRKILKKYRRWTRDTELDRQFKDEVTNSQSSFYQLDLGFLLDKYIDVLGVLRAVFDASGAPGPSSSAQGSSPASRISQAVYHGTEVEFDLTFSLTPLGSSGSKATYWIHPDQIVEVEVLLLQQMRLYPGLHASTPHQSHTTIPSHRISAANAESQSGIADNVGHLILDHPESFAIKQNASTIGSSEENTGTLQAKAAGDVRWASSGDAAVVVGLEDTTKEIRLAKLKRKHLTAFLDTEAPLDTALPNGLQTEGDENADINITNSRQWLAEHKDVKPIVGVCSKRTRFVGLHNNVSGGTWATLDSNVFMKTSMQKDLSNEEWWSDAQSGSKGFPHAVLEVRQEGNHSSTLIQILNRSYLVWVTFGIQFE